MLPYMENEEHIGNILFIFAGYPKSSVDENDVRELFRIDAGLNSRIVKQNQFLLPDYSPDEMVDIFFLFSKLKNIEVENSEIFKSTLKEQIQQAKSQESAREFGNARRMRTHIEYLKEAIWADHSRNNITLQDLQDYPL